MVANGHQQLTFHDAIGFSPALTAQGVFGCVSICTDLDITTEHELAVEAPTDPLWLSLTSRPISVSSRPLCAFPHLTSKPDANGGIDDIVEAQRPFALKHGVSFGDL